MTTQTRPFSTSPIVRVSLFVWLALLSVAAGSGSELNMLGSEAGTPTPTATSTPCDNIVFDERFDSVTAPFLPGGWISSNYTGPGPYWVTSTADPFSSPNSAFINDASELSDKRLTSPPIVVNAFDPLLTFHIRFNTEFSGGIYWDGAVLEVSSPNINRGAFTDITHPMIGGEFVSGGYTGVISSAAYNPLAGRMAWSGDSGGYILSSVRLQPGLVGQPITLRFRMGTDLSEGGEGMFVDDIQIRSCTVVTPSPTSTPTATPTATPSPTASPTPTPSCPVIDLFTDNTFEAGYPWPAWSLQGSTNFGTPLCNVLICGSSNAATGPFGGTNWAWFGGVDGISESSYLGRTVNIPLNRPATLTFQLKAGEVSAPFTDVLNVRVDNDIVASFAEPAIPDAAYSLRTVDLTGFANGAFHTIGFEYSHTGAGISSFTLDNVSLLSDRCGPSLLRSFDYDGDSRSDISVFRRSTATWYVQRSTLGFYGAQFGNSNDKITPADYDGDRKTDLAFYRPSERRWYIFYSSTRVPARFSFGLPDDIPVPGDYDGDGRDDLAVFRPSNGKWYVTRSSNGSFITVQFGMNGDKPTIGDFDNDGTHDFAFFRPSIGVWFRINSSNGELSAEQFGLSDDKLVAADYDGDRRTDIAVYRPSDGIWYIKNSATNTVTASVFGLSADIPAVGDYDGDAKADIAVFRPSDGVWHIANSSDGSFTVMQFGTNGDTPTQNAFGY
jgi:hypothetical protein